MKKYLITATPFCEEQLQTHMPDYVLYRDKTTPYYETQAEHFMEVCSNFEGIKSFIHRHVELAYKIGATGVHLTSTQFEKIKRAKELGLEVIISTHTHEEVLKAERLGADAVTYSPIFVSPEKGTPKGVEDLKELLQKCTLKVFALGGIVEPWHVEMIEETKVYGFASIRYFTN
ncbi:MAG: thiamine phosphate synthase [Campylobacterales bacterium]|nr:thiamine phosphate synthase [Campylobacterales bacterium]